MLPISVVSDLAWTVRDLVRMSERKGKGRGVLPEYYIRYEYKDEIRKRT